MVVLQCFSSIYGEVQVNRTNDETFQIKATMQIYIWYNDIQHDRQDI